MYEMSVWIEMNVCVHHALCTYSVEEHNCHPWIGSLMVLLNDLWCTVSVHLQPPYSARAFCEFRVQHFCKCVCTIEKNGLVTLAKIYLIGFFSGDIFALANFVLIYRNINAECKEWSNSFGTNLIIWWVNNSSNNNSNRSCDNN